MKYLTLLLSISVTYSQDIQQTSETKRSSVYGQDCDDTEYRNSKDIRIGKTMEYGCLNVTQSVL